MFFIQDEYMMSKGDLLNFHRLSASVRSCAGWIIGERFDDQYDTEVGGFATLLTQRIDKDGNYVSEYSRDENGSIKTVRNPSVIVDYQDNARRYSIEEAEGTAELAPVLARLKEREGNYLVHLGKLENSNNEC